MRIPVPPKKPLRIRNTNVLKVKEGMREVFSDELNKSGRRFEQRMSGHSKDQLVDKFIIFLSSNSLVRPALVSLAEREGALARKARTHNVKFIIEEGFVVRTYIQNNRQRLRGVNATNEAAFIPTSMANKTDA